MHTGPTPVHLQERTNTSFTGEIVSDSGRDARANKAKNCRPKKTGPCRNNQPCPSVEGRGDTSCLRNGFSKG